MLGEMKGSLRAKGERVLTEHKKGPKNKEKEKVAVPIEGETTEKKAEAKAADGDGQERGGEKEVAPLEKLQAQLEEKTQAAAGYYDQWLRLRAEFENFKKRMQKEKADFLKFGNESLLKAILPILDNLERAIEHGKSVPECSSLLDGVKMTHKQLSDTVEKFGLKTFPVQGEVFDPERHEAVYHQESDEEANRVIGEMEKGYFFQERLLRPAKVIVSKGKASSAKQGMDA
jgi:molecular chaperone GrpE